MSLDDSINGVDDPVGCHDVAVHDPGSAGGRHNFHYATLEHLNKNRFYYCVLNFNYHVTVLQLSATVS